MEQRKCESIWDSTSLQEHHCTIMASKSNWVDGEAIEQLKHVAGLPGITWCYGMPDLHPGKGIPVGAVCVSQDTIYPHLVGNDIGCGMGFWQLDLKSSKFKGEKTARKLSGLESVWQGDHAAWLQARGLDSELADEALGTIGGGNHFAELQTIDTVHDTELFESLGLDKRRLMLLIHSGSRGLGQSVLTSHLDQHGATGLISASQHALAYLDKHNRALAWASANRHLIAYRFAEQLNAAFEPVLDCCHNSVTLEELDGQPVWLHRKGAAPSNTGPVIIPGTRGTLSYLVNPCRSQNTYGLSLAHGAGRKWNRKSAKARLIERFSAQSLMQTELGSHVICEDKQLLFEEAPQAYKSIVRVIQDMVEAGMVTVIATLRPLITYKVRQHHD